jgi:hypothetical protein
VPHLEPSFLRCWNSDTSECGSEIFRKFGEGWTRSDGQII